MVVNDRVCKDVHGNVYQEVAGCWPVVAASAPQPSLPVWTSPVPVAAQSVVSASQLAPGAAAWEVKAPADAPETSHSLVKPSATGWAPTSSTPGTLASSTPALSLFSSASGS